MGNSKKSASYFKLQRKHTVDFEVFKKVLGYPPPPTLLQVQSLQPRLP